MPWVHLGILVMEDGILYNLPNIERYILDDGIVEQGSFGRYFTHIHRRNEMRCDEVMPDLRDVGQMFGLKVNRVPLTVNLPLTSPVGQYPNDLRVVGLCMEPINGLRGNWFKVVVLVDRLRAEVYEHLAHPNLLQYMGGKIGVEFSHHTYGSWCRGLAQCPPPLVRNCFAKEVIEMVKPLLLNKRPILGNEAELLSRTLIDKLVMVITACRLFTNPTSLGGHLLPLTRHGHEWGLVELGIQVWCTYLWP